MNNFNDGEGGRLSSESSSQYKREAEVNDHFSSQR